jgi:hypothetical protein
MREVELDIVPEVTSYFHLNQLRPHLETMLTLLFVPRLLEVVPEGARVAGREAVLSAVLGDGIAEVFVTQKTTRDIDQDLADTNLLVTVRLILPLTRKTYIFVVIGQVA